MTSKQLLFFFHSSLHGTGVLRFKEDIYEYERHRRRSLPKSPGRHLSTYLLYLSRPACHSVMRSVVSHVAICLNCEEFSLPTVRRFSLRRKKSLMKRTEQSVEHMERVTLYPQLSRLQPFLVQRNRTLPASVDCPRATTQNAIVVLPSTGAHACSYLRCRCNPFADR